MDFKEVGDIFRKEREHRGLSIKEVMEVTKISRRNLLAIEEGNGDDLPHPVYAKGFIRSYARFLGLDGEELAQVFDSEGVAHATHALNSTDYEVTPEADLAFQDMETGPRGRKNSLPSILIIIVLLALLGGLVYYFGFYQKTPLSEHAEFSMGSPVQEATSGQGDGVEISGDSTAIVAPDNVMEGAVQSDSGKVSPVGGEATAQEIKNKENSEAATAVSVSSAGSASVSAGHDSEETAVGEHAEQVSSQEAKYAHVLLIRATSEQGCWVGVWKSDENAMARDFFLRNGEPLRLKFNSFRRIRIGNVPGVVVQYNGKDYPLDPKKGKTQDLRFGKD